MLRKKGLGPLRSVSVPEGQTLIDHGAFQQPDDTCARRKIPFQPQ
jgi:hypothetical protein